MENHALHQSPARGGRFYSPGIHPWVEGVRKKSPVGTTDFAPQAILFKIGRAYGTLKKNATLTPD